MNILIIFSVSLVLMSPQILGEKDKITNLPNIGLSTPPSEDVNRTIGGLDEVALDDPEILGILNSNLSRINTGDSSKLELVKVTKITTQVVAGHKHDVTGTFKLQDKEVECVVSIWHQAWLEKIDERYKIKAVCDGKTLKADNDKQDW